MADRVKEDTITIPGYSSAKPRLFQIRIVDASRNKYQLSRVWRVDLFDKPGLMSLLSRQVGGDGGFDLDKCNYAVAVKEEHPSKVKTIIHRAHNVSGLPWVGSDFEWHGPDGKLSSSANVTSLADHRAAKIQENIDRLISACTPLSDNTPSKTYPRYDLASEHYD